MVASVSGSISGPLISGWHGGPAGLSRGEWSSRVEKGAGIFPVRFLKVWTSLVVFLTCLDSFMVFWCFFECILFVVTKCSTAHFALSIIARATATELHEPLPAVARPFPRTATLTVPRWWAAVVKLSLLNSLSRSITWNWWQLAILGLAIHSNP